MSKKTLKLETLAVAHDSYELIVKIKLKCTLINHDTHSTCQLQSAYKCSVEAWNDQQAILCKDYIQHVIRSIDPDEVDTTELEIVHEAQTNWLKTHTLTGTKVVMPLTITSTDTIEWKAGSVYHHYPTTPTAKL